MFKNKLKDLKTPQTKTESNFIFTQIKGT